MKLIKTVVQGVVINLLVAGGVYVAVKLIKREIKRGTIPSLDDFLDVGEYQANLGKKMEKFKEKVELAIDDFKLEKDSEEAKKNVEVLVKSKPIKSVKEPAKKVIAKKVAPKVKAVKQKVDKK